MAMGRRRASTFSFGKPAFWSEFYKRKAVAGKPAGFEWFCDFEQVGPILARVLAPTLEKKTNQNTPCSKLRVLHIGCGTSWLGEELQRDLQERTSDAEVDVEVWNIDNVPEAIQAMREQRNVDPSRYLCIDATSMVEFEDSSFDIVLDKVKLQ